MAGCDNYPIAAVVSSGGSGADDLVAGFALQLRHRGWWVRGLVQESHEDGRGHWHTSLVDLDNGRVFPISQNLGSHSRCCRVDTQGLADATSVMRRVTAEGADLVVFNRFAGLEALGQGFAAEMLLLMAEGIPVLTVMPERYLPAWRRFTGGGATQLRPERSALDGWLASLWPTAPASHGIPPGYGR